MKQKIDISVSFETEGATTPAEAITTLFEAAKTSDDEPLMKVIHCSVIPESNPEHQEQPEVHAVVRAESQRFDAESITPWLNKMLDDVKEGQPTVRSLDVVDASTAQ